MPTLISSPFSVPGVAPKTIDEYVGKANTGEHRVSIAHMKAPVGWSEPGQRPAFDEWTLVLVGVMRVEHEDGHLDVTAGQAVHCAAGEWVRYSTPIAATEYVAVCLPAFDPETAGREA